MRSPPLTLGRTPPGQQTCTAWKVHLPKRLLACALMLFDFPPSTLLAANTIHVGTCTNNPRVFRNAKGVHQGIYIGLLEHVANNEGWTLQYVKGSWDECLRRLQRGRLKRNGNGPLEVEVMSCIR